MSAVARSQIRPPETVAPPTSVPVPVVPQLLSMVSPLTIDTRVAPPSRLTPIQAEESRSIASPARSPSRHRRVVELDRRGRGRALDAVREGVAGRSTGRW